MPLVHPTKDLPVKVEEYSSLGLKTTNYGEQEQQQQKTKKNVIPFEYSSQYDLEGQTI